MILQAQVAGIRMEYLTFGTGKTPLVILPGVSLRSTLLSAAAVKKRFERFCDSHTVFLFDRRMEMPEDYDVSAMADDTAAVMRHLGISGAHVCGVSQGGMIAQLLAARYPELVSRLVLASTLYRQNEVSREVFSTWLAMAEQGKREELNQHMFSRIYSPAYYRRYQKAFDVLARQGTEKEFHRLQILIRACLTYDGTDEIGNIRCPVLVIGSLQDRVLTGEASRELAERLGGRCFLYPEQGHAVFDEDPAFLDRVYDFFAE